MYLPGITDAWSPTTSGASESSDGEPAEAPATGAAARARPVSTATADAVQVRVDVMKFLSAISCGHAVDTPLGEPIGGDVCESLTDASPQGNGLPPPRSNKREKIGRRSTGSTP